MLDFGKCFARVELVFICLKHCNLFLDTLPEMDYRKLYLSAKHLIVSNRTRLTAHFPQCQTHFLHLIPWVAKAGQSEDRKLTGK